jgi:hypothetical protein
MDGATRGRTQRVKYTIGGSTRCDVERVVQVRARWPVPTSTCVVGSWSAGCEARGKAQGRPSHPGATGERQSGRVKNLNLRPMSRHGQLRRWDAVAEYRDWPLRSGRRRPGTPLSREEHRRPRGTGGTHPARSSCVRNAVTPVEVRTAMSGKPTVRKPRSRGGNLMTEKRMSAAETRQETGT